ncbi:MAG: PAS domain-containing protein, partial [Leptospiraceae bacterium]|nr:PAS domain-containing protein [Leptospiraceae bacterium]
MTGSPNCIVTIGTSAGGHPALEALFRNIVPDLDVSYIVGQHLSPDHQSILPEIISAYAPLPARLLEQRTIIQPRTIYVVPPGKTAYIRNRSVVLEERATESHISTLVDTLFRSVSEEMGSHCVGIVLSGAGSDGAAGIRLIKESGGLTVVQEPASAAFPSMPDMAMQSTEIDLVIPPEKMGAGIARYVELIRDSDEMDEDLERLLDRITSRIEEGGGPSFSQYKRATLKRRLEKRLSVHSSTIDEYINRIETDNEELEAVHREFLIGVTEFFRDSEVFTKIESNVLPELIQSNETVRIWCIGCSTGEEPYSMAISAMECMRKLNIHRELQIFASDLDDRALSVARDGVYLQGALASMDRERINRYFITQGQTFKIKKEIRDSVIFAEHDILKDPPYSRINLIACRNLLIYLNKESQKRVLASIHYSLASDGIAVLGKSESLGDLAVHFNDVDRTNRIFSKRPDNAGAIMHLFSRPRHDHRTSSLQTRHSGIPERARSAILNRFTPPSVIVNDRNRIVFVQGRTSRWLEIPTGETTNDLLSMVGSDLRVSLANVLRRCRNEASEVTVRNVRFTDRDGEPGLLDLIATPLPENLENSEHLVMIAFLNQERPEISADESEGIPSSMALARELQETRSYLETTIEQLEATNEELRASNEEGQAINEELQSANEELETSREELQSLNEELMTTNAELQHKVEALAKANNDIYNLMRSSQIAALFLDREFQITWFSPALTKIVDLLEGDVGRPIRQFRTSLQKVDLAQTAGQVLSALVPVEMAVNTDDDTYLWMRVLPYRTLE